MKIRIGAPIYDKREISAVLRALRQKRLTQGAYVRDFERAWAGYLGRKFGVAANSGSSANLIALAAMKECFGWKDKEAVLVPVLTFPTAVTPVLQMKLRPVWTEVDASGNVTLDSVRVAAGRHRGGRIRGIVVVHSLGVPCADIAKIRRWAKLRGWPMLEDACESHGAEVGGRRVGAFGDVSTSSFHVAHNMTTGEGGMIATDNKALAMVCRSLREFGRDVVSKDRGRRYAPLATGDLYDVQYIFHRPGYNLRMTDITASLGLVQLTKLEVMNRKRQRIVKWYRECLAPLINSGHLAVPPERATSRNTYYALQLTFLKMPRGYSNLKSVAMALESRGIETRRFMGGNLLRQQVFYDGTPPGRFAVADFLHHRSLLIGCHPLVTKSQVRYVCRAIEKLYY